MATRLPSPTVVDRSSCPIDSSLETVDASFTWPGPRLDVLRNFVEPTPEPWGAEVINEDVVLFRALDERENLSDRVAGLEIVGYLDFDRWNDLPQLDLRWRLPDQQPRPLIEFLKHLQAGLRVRAEALALSRR
jgi:hypothetical protein